MATVKAPQFMKKPGEEPDPWAWESKEELRKMSDVPFITNIGRKGGSPAASSIINAIMLLYQQSVNKSSA